MAFLPQKWFGDSNRLLDMANNVVEGRGSYAATAAIYALFPLWMLNSLVTAVGVIFLYVATQSAKTLLSFCIMTLLLLLSVPQTLLVPIKETVVISMTLILVLASRKISGVALFAIIIGAYLAYGGFIRSYYLLILLVWVALEVFVRANLLMKISLLLFFIASLLLMPVSIMQQMQGQRDAANSWALYKIYSDNRTAFFNPLPPTDLWNFLVNYIYAAGILNIPLLKWWSAKEVVFSFGLLGCFTVLGRALSERGTSVRSFGLLFLSHLLILCTFEPDLGSYFRHFTSVLAYLFPAFALLGLRQVTVRAPALAEEDQQIP
jgi:hypothetical protein